MKAYTERVEINVTYHNVFSFGPYDHLIGKPHFTRRAAHCAALEAYEINPDDCPLVLRIKVTWKLAK